MTDWNRSMQQSFEFYEVDPGTWGDKKLIDNITSCSIDYDSSTETLGSASFDVNGNVGECYIRIYLVTIQNKIKERYPLGTFLVQTPSDKFDGKVHNISLDAYTPLIELKENPPPLGYTIMKGKNVMNIASTLCIENMRAPVVSATNDTELFSDFVSDTSDTWISFLTDLIANAKYKFGLDEMGRVIFLPRQDMASLQPVWTYDDTNSSILYPDITVDRDLYGIPNVVEISYSGDSGNYYAKAVNDDPNSPTSTISRGRTITHRVTDPDLTGNPSQGEIEEYATQLLRDLSALEYTISYTHGYCPVRMGDCILLNCKRAGLINIKAIVTEQSIDCKTGCSVAEKATSTVNLWG